MPSPIAHAALGYAVYRVFKPYLLGENEPSILKDRQLLTLAFGLSLLPDLDFLPGLLTDNAGEFHNGATHSPLMAVLVAVAAAVLARRRSDRWRTYFVFVLAAYGLHVLADFVTMGRGTMVLWPVSDERISPPLHIFYGLRRSEGIVSSLHFITLVNELLFVAALLGVLRVATHIQQFRLRSSDKLSTELPDNQG